jgi:hypothetical protein
MGRDDEHTWTELVESFHATTQDADRTWPAAEDVDTDKASGSDYDSSATTTSPGLGFSEPDGNSSAADAPGLRPANDPSPQASVDDDHFVPPTPPPIPQTDMITMLAWFGVFGTPVLFAGAYVFSYRVAPLISFMAVIAFVGGFAVLISRLKGHDPHDPDNGAVV